MYVCKINQLHILFELNICSKNIYNKKLTLENFCQKRYIPEIENDFEDKSMKKCAPFYEKFDKLL